MMYMPWHESKLLIIYRNGNFHFFRSQLSYQYFRIKATISTLRTCQLQKYYMIYWPFTLFHFSLHFHRLNLYKYSHSEYWYFDFICCLVAIIKYYLLYIVIIGRLIYERKYYTFVRIISCQMMRTRRTSAVWLEKLAIELLTIERLRNVMRQFFVPSPPLIFCPFHWTSFLFAGYSLPFFSFLGRSRFYSSQFHFLFTTTCDLYGLFVGMMTKENDKSLERKSTDASNARGPFRNFKLRTS